MLEEFKKFLLRGNVVDLAVGVVIGGAFGAIVKSLVDDLIMPVVGLATGGIDFKEKFVLLKVGKTAAAHYATMEEATKDGAVLLRYGVFFNTIISFIIIGTALFLIVRAVNKLHPAPAAVVDKKDCPHCGMSIPLKATRCPHCTSALDGVAAAKA
jgi:large conductance mechanosensitive channel